jgi:hypothetical protein
MEIVLMLLCIAGLAFAVKTVEGPFGLVAKLRNLLAKVPVVGTTFFKVLTCDFCLGFWSSVVVYVAVNGFSLSSLNDLLIWGFGGAMFNALFGAVMGKLNITV